MELPDTSQVEIRGDDVTLRTRNPQRFYVEFGALVVRHRLDARRLETLDAGAEAVFGYLERSAT